jgi:hypothetical protein
MVLESRKDVSVDNKLLLVATKTSSALWSHGARSASNFC